LHFEALAVVRRRFHASDDTDRIVRRNLAGRPARMARRPAVAEQQDQFAGVLHRIAEVGGIEPEIGEGHSRRRPAGLPVGVARELEIFRSSRCERWARGSISAALKPDKPARTILGREGCGKSAARHHPPYFIYPHSR
jgi:hypothetical protein